MHAEPITDCYTWQSVVLNLISTIMQSQIATLPFIPHDVASCTPLTNGSFAVAKCLEFKKVFV